MNNPINKFGLSDREYNTIHGVFRQYPDVLLVHIFGSRAKGNNKLGSDVDLAIMNSGMPLKVLLRLKGDFEESSLPFKIDLVDYNSLTNTSFIDHIQRVGKLFYERNEMGNLR